MQWPPTAMPGWWMWLYGWLLQASITWKMSMPVAVGEAGELVGQADVDVAVGGLGELGQLGGLGGAQVPHAVAALEVGALVEVQDRLVER